MIIDRSGTRTRRETRAERKSRYAKKAGRITGRFVKVPLESLATAYGHDVVAVVKAGAVRYVIADRDDGLILMRDASGSAAHHCEAIGGFPPGTGRLSSVKQLRDTLDRGGGGYNRILYAVPFVNLVR